jgi:CTP:molybdopterin cytidylyltransferase MocA
MTARAVAILLLAAGASRRMAGRDKLLEPVGRPPVPLIRDRALACLGAGAARVVAVLPPGAAARRAALAGLELELVEAAAAAEGLSASLRAGLAAAPEAEAALVVLADMPDLTAADLASILATPRGDGVILRGAGAGGEPGHPVLIPRRDFAALARVSGDAGARDLLRAEAHRVRLVPLPGRHALTDLDTPEAWEAWRASRDA